MTRVIGMTTPDKFDAGLREVGVFIGEQRAKLESAAAAAEFARRVEVVTEAMDLCNRFPTSEPATRAYFHLREFLLELVPDSSAALSAALAPPPAPGKGE